ncbi:MAG: glycogen debranching protein GlgX [Rhodothermia bacterium]|nr:MAG: glycogen debranching protein GlgX [Rhodothermia bacterium]
MNISPGNPSPLGSAWKGQGVNFALYSEHATRVELVLFSDEPDPHPAQSMDLPGRSGAVWHGFVGGGGPGQLYGFRVHGPFDPDRGHRFAPKKILLDPYARAIGRATAWDESLLAHDEAHRNLDSAGFAPLGRVENASFDWESDKPPNTAWSDTIIYETHVRGISFRHPEVPSEQRGTFAGLASEPIIDHLKSLGITAVELLPVHAKFSEKRLEDAGLTNYWGYSPLSYFAPEPSYAATDDPVSEFKSMVKKLHQAGLEVLIDVVFNHTAEGDTLGPTLSFRGIDNHTYYKPKPDHPGKLADYTGTGNTLDASHPQVRRLILDSLRYWTDEMHVDGFRFDLATVLARDPHKVNMQAPMIRTLQGDSVLSEKKLIVEPWDLGPGGHQAGSFPKPFREWDDEFRDRTRQYWSADLGSTTPSEGLESLRPSASSSINFVTAHDGFTLQDLVSYEKKHNLANLENNRDGHVPNYSSNQGVEGPTSDKTVLDGREALKRNLIESLLSAPGVPMILGGDEISRTQRGNNNAYCQDNLLSWYDWYLDDRKDDFLDYFRNIIRERKAANGESS